MKIYHILKLLVITIFLLLSSNYTSIITGYSSYSSKSSWNYYNDTYENIFEDKEEVRIVPWNNIRTTIFLMPFLLMLDTSEQMQKMVDPSVDDAPGSFSYFAEPTYQMGLPGEKNATQITPEGHPFTCAAELEFFAGENMELISQRIWTLHEGYLPCVNYQFESNDLLYSIQVFQYWLDEKYDSPPVNFVRGSVTNTGMGSREAIFSIGFEYGSIDHRVLDLRRNRTKNRIFLYDFYDKFNPFWKYEMTDISANRDNKIIYLWDETPTEKWQRNGQIYQKPFCCFNREIPVCITSYNSMISPNQTVNYTFKMPAEPIEVSNTPIVGKLIAADIDERLSQFESFWESTIVSDMSIFLPEDKVMETSRASLVNLFMCQDFISENEIKPVPNRFQYNDIWLRDCAYFCLMYSVMNYPETTEKILRHLLTYQADDGQFSTQTGQLDGTGNVLFTFGQHIRMTHDADFAQTLLPSVCKGVEWIKETLDDDPFGIMPATNAWDGERVIGHYTSHNLWSLMGLDGAIIVAREAGENEKAEEFTVFLNQYYDHFIKQLRIASSRNNGIIPPGMDVDGGIDCNNLLVVHPGHLLNPFDPLVNNTFTFHRENTMEEGLFLYYNSLHHYFTERMAHTALIRGEQENVLKDFYGMLLHTGSCHGGFEFCVFPWLGRDYCIINPRYPRWHDCNFPPHNAFSAKFNTLLRMMLIREYNETLHLLSVISPEWVKPGDKIELNNAPTWFGTINLNAEAHQGGLRFEYDPCWVKPPNSVILHLPFFTNVSEVEVNGDPVSYEAESVRLPNYRCTVNISWQIDPSVKYSYNKTVEDYKDEYQRLFNETK